MGEFLLTALKVSGMAVLIAFAFAALLSLPRRSYRSVILSDKDIWLLTVSRRMVWLWPCLAVIVGVSQGALSGENAPVVVGAAAGALAMLIPGIVYLTRSIKDKLQHDRDSAATKTVGKRLLPLINQRLKDSGVPCSVEIQVFDVEHGMHGSVFISVHGTDQQAEHVFSIIRPHIPAALHVRVIPDSPVGS